MIPLKDVNPTRRPAVLTIALIAVCVLVFGYQQTKADDLSLDSRQGFICEHGLIADNLVHGADRPPVDGCDQLNQEHDRLLPLHRNLFLEANPIPVKWAAAQMGLIPGGIRLPLTPLSAACHEQVREAMRHAGIRAEVREERYAAA